MDACLHLFQPHLYVKQAMKNWYAAKEQLKQTLGKYIKIDNRF